MLDLPHALTLIAPLPSRGPPICDAFQIYQRVYLAVLFAPTCEEK